MTPLLDDVPYPFQRPDGQELLSKLTLVFPSKAAAVAVAQAAGIDVSSIFQEQAVTFLWHDILGKAAVDGLLRSMIQQVFDRLASTSPIRPFLADLLADRQPVVSSEPRTPDGAPNFIARSDELTEMEQENLLFQDDLTMQIGQVPKLIQTLQRLVELAPSVCRLVIDVHGTNQYGTGFRIGPDWLLTNWHVVHNRSSLPATRITAEFGYEDDGAGGPLVPAPVECTTKLIAADKADDWAIIQTTQPMAIKTPAIRLTEAVNPELGRTAFVIQHPNSDRKRLAYVRNQVSFVDDRVVQYLADTQAGSSGSPVFNAEGKLIGLHHAGGRPQEVLGKAPMRKNEGIRISRILKGLAEAGISMP